MCIRDRKYSLLIGDGTFFTPMLSFVTVLNAPIPKDPSIRSVVEYTREAEIKSVYWRLYVLYTFVVVCYCTDDLSSIILSYPLRTQVFLNSPEKPKLSLLIRDGMFYTLV